VRRRRRRKWCELLLVLPLPLLLAVLVLLLLLLGVASQTKIPDPFLSGSLGGFSLSKSLSRRDASLLVVSRTALAGELLVEGRGFAGVPLVSCTDGQSSYCKHIEIGSTVSLGTGLRSERVK
jgi:hypothetical protein